MGAMLRAIEPLEETELKPIPNFQKNMITEFEPAHRELETLDTVPLERLEQFLSIARRLEPLSATLTLLTGTDEHETVWRNQWGVRAVPARRGHK